jgi:hypothetical protein
MTPHDAVIYAFLLAAVGIFLARDWIRARFKRNMPSDRFRDGTTGWPPPPRAWPLHPEPPSPSVREIPTAGPISAGDPVSIGPDGAAVSELGESIRAASKMFSRGFCRGRRVTVDGDPRYVCEKGIGPSLGLFVDGAECPQCRRVIAATDLPEETAEEKEAQRAESEEWNRAYKINVMAERLFVEQRCDPEQAYADAARWVDSRVAVALAEHRDPGAADASGDKEDAPTEMLFAEDPPGFAHQCPYCGAHALVTTRDGFFSCSSCGVSSANHSERRPLAGSMSRCPEHAENYPFGEKCPGCAERNARMASEPLIATVNESFHWRIDPEAETPTARGGEDGCLVRFDGEAFEFEQPASYVYPPALPVAVADALRFGTNPAMFLDDGGSLYAKIKDAAQPPTISVAAVLSEPPSVRAVEVAAGRVVATPRGPDIERLLALAEFLHEFDAHQLLNLATARDPELAARIDARKANDHLRRAATSGRLEVVRPGKRGAVGYMPTYRLAAPRPTGVPLAKIASLHPEAMNALAPPLHGEQEENEPGSELQPARTPPPRRAQSRCLVHGVDLMSEDDLCYLCMGRAKR